MQKFKYIILLIILLCIACIRNNDNPKHLYLTDNDILVERSVDSLLNCFMGENLNTDCQYFLITYLSSDKRIVTFIANNLGGNYIKDRRPLFYFAKNNRKVYVIMGIENIFKVSSEQYNKSEMRKGEPFYSKIKSYVIDKDSIEFIPNGIPPFAPPPSLVMVDSLK